LAVADYESHLRFASKAQATRAARKIRDAGFEVKHVVRDELYEADQWVVVTDAAPWNSDFAELELGEADLREWSPKESWYLQASWGPGLRGLPGGKVHRRDELVNLMAQLEMALRSLKYAEDRVEELEEAVASAERSLRRAERG
jgi:hypothetical protein